MGLAVSESFSPPEQVIDARYQIGIHMPSAVRGTAEGGLAITPAGLSAKRRLQY